MILLNHQITQIEKRNDLRMKVFNYIRVSTKEQNEERQVVAMNEFNQANGFDNAIQMIDKASGTNTDRPQLQLMLQVVGEGDLVVIKSIDRLSRNYDECRRLWQEITTQTVIVDGKEIIKPKADIVVLDMPLLDTRKHKDLLGSFISDLILQVLAYVGQQETDFRAKRQAEGIKAMPTDENGKKYSKKTGRATGRPCAELPEGFEEQYQAWKRGEQKATETFKNLGLTKTTFYKLVKQYEQTKATE